ncbi:hypothetical protein LINPERHAP2_LOCUS41245 [Linum perenne]
MCWVFVTQTLNSFIVLLGGKVLLMMDKFSVETTTYVMLAMPTLKGFLPHSEARDIIYRNGAEIDHKLPKNTII